MPLAARAAGRARRRRQPRAPPRRCDAWRPQPRRASGLSSSTGWPSRRRTRRAPGRRRWRWPFGWPSRTTSPSAPSGWPRRPPGWPPTRPGRAARDAARPGTGRPDRQNDPQLRRWALTAAIAALGAAESDRRAAASIWTARARVEEELGDPEAAAESRRAALRRGADLPAGGAGAAHDRRAFGRRAGDRRRRRGRGVLPGPGPQIGCGRCCWRRRWRWRRSPPARGARARPTCARRWRSIRRTRRRSSGCDRCWPSRGTRGRWRRRWPPASTSRRTRSRSPRCAWRAPSCWRASSAIRTARARELEAVLRKQPEHPRALEALSELLWERQDWGEAGEIYLRRAVVERDPADALPDLPAPRSDLLDAGPGSQARGGRVRARAGRRRPRTWRRCGRCPTSTCARGRPSARCPSPSGWSPASRTPARRHRTRVRLGELLMQVGDLRARRRRAAPGGRRGAARRRGGRRRWCSCSIGRAIRPGAAAVLDRAVGLLRHDLVAARRPARRDAARAGHAAGAARAPARGAAPPRSCWRRSAGAGGVRAARAGPQPGGAAPAGARRARLPVRAAAPGVRHLLRLLGPLLRPSGAELAQRLGAPRAHPGRPPHPRRAAATAVRRRRRRAGRRRRSTSTCARRPRPPGRSCCAPSRAIRRPSSSATRWKGWGRRRCASRRRARCACRRRTWTCCWPVPPEEAGALLVGIIRQFVPDYQHEAVRDALVDAETARARAAAIPRKLKPAGHAVRGRERGRRSTWPALLRRGARRRQRGRPAGVRRSAGRAVGGPASCRDRRWRRARPRGRSDAGGHRAPTRRRWRCCASRSPTTYDELAQRAGVVTRARAC